MHLELDLDPASAEYLKSRLDAGESAADVIGLALQLLEEWEDKKLTTSEPGDTISEEDYQAWMQDLLAKKALAEAEPEAEASNGE